MEFRSDNCAGVAPQILAAVAHANRGSALAYGDDPWTERLTAVVRDVFEHPTATVFPVSTGTAANALSLAALAPPWAEVVCHETAHILVNECGATSMFGGGLSLRGLPGKEFRLHAEEVRRYLDGAGWGDPHRAQPAVVSLTQPTDYGTTYAVDDVENLTAVARDRSMRVHMDGARLANALVTLGCSPAALTWKAGVDVLSLGATKNGAMNADAIVCFDPRAAHELRYRTKRAGHTASKMRFQSAQLVAYLTGGLWLELASVANRAMNRLAAGLSDLRVECLNEPDVNILFVRLPDVVIGRMEAAGLLFYRIEPGVIRLVTSFQTSDPDVDRAIEIVRVSMQQ